MPLMPLMLLLLLLLLLHRPPHSLRPPHSQLYHRA
jgi:hypothetical protein